MYLLDTNHCSYLIRKEPTVYQRSIAIGTENLATCVIVQGELIFMAEKSEQKQQNLANVNNFLQYLRIYLTDETTAVIYGQLKAAVINQFAPLQHNLILVSADSDFKRIQTVRNLPVETWYTPST